MTLPHRPPPLTLVRVRLQEEFQDIFIVNKYITVKAEEEPSSVGVHRASPAKVDVQVTPEEEITEEDAEIAANTANTNMESYGTCAVALYDYQVKPISK